MNEILNILPETLNRDGLVRTARWIYNQPLYNKKLEFAIPNFALHISNSQMINVLDIRLEIAHLLSEHSKSYVQKIFDVDNTIIDQVKNVQKNLDGEYLNTTFRNFFYNNLMILDFASDSLYYTKYLKKISETMKLPTEVRALAKDLFLKHTSSKNAQEYKKYSDKKIDEFWNKILKDDKSIMNFEARIHEQGINSYGDIVIPFTKQIKNSRKELAEVEKINNAWMSLNRAEYKPAVAYLSLSQSVLWNQPLISGIIDYIETLDADILVIKIKNLHLTDGSRHSKPRELLKSILEVIAKKKEKSKNLLTICLECSEHLYPLAVQAFDIVSTLPNMFDKETESGGGTENGRRGGKALDEDTLGLTDYEDWQKRFAELGYFPCSHDICHARITNMNDADYPARQWYVDLRRHNILTITDWLQMIAESVTNQQADLAVDRLRNSPLKVLTELLVRNYEDPTEFLG